MAFAAINMGAGTIANSKTGTTFAATMSAAASIGNMVVVAVASDNFGTTDAVGADNIASVTDSGGNTYTLAHSYRNGQGAAQAGAHVSIWYSIITTALTTSSTVTVTNTTTAYARAMVVKSFTKGATTTIGIAATGEVAVDGNTADQVILSGLVSREYLLFGACAVEITAANMTGDNQYVNGFTAFTAGGGAATNMSCYAEHRIATLTTDTWDPDCDNVDNVIAIVAFYEISAGGVITRSFGTVCG